MLNSLAFSITLFKLSNLLTASSILACLPDSSFSNFFCFISSCSALLTSILLADWTEVFWDNFSITCCLLQSMLHSCSGLSDMRYNQTPTVTSPAQAISALFIKNN
jgi:hypothetical protein